ncbi:MAG: hypothetical protein OIF47_02120 [Marinibacterium sp.]|nr:hypothetical protein [Marinibacterium sp.]
MTRVLPLVVILAALAACTTAPETYPVSDDVCGPDDAVKELSVPNCAPTGSV